MSKRIDPFTIAGVAFFAAGALVAAYMATEPDASADRATEQPAGEAGNTRQERASTQERQGGDSPASTGGAPANTADVPAGTASAPARANGWVPAGSRESVEQAQVESGLPALGPSCNDTVDPIELGKQVGTVVAEQIRAAGRMSLQEEIAIGARLEAELHNTPPFAGKVDLPADVAKYGPYLRQLIAQLVAHSSRNGELVFRIHTVRNDTFNAFALPGGVLGIHTGVLVGPNAVHDEAELMAVLGHEIAHVELRHPIAAFEAARAVLGPSADDAAILAQMAQMPIQSEYEHQSDRRGIALAAAAQYDPAAASRLWSRMAQQDPKRGAGSNPLEVLVGGAERLLATHPPSALRCARTRPVAVVEARHSGWPRFYRGASNVAERTPGPTNPR